MTKDIKDAKIGDILEWDKFGRWVRGAVIDVVPGMGEADPIQGLVIECNGKHFEASLEKLAKCKANFVGETK